MGGSLPATVVVPTAAIVFAVSIIGLPVAVILWFAPALIVLAAAGDIARVAMPRWPAPAAALTAAGLLVAAGSAYALVFDARARKAQNFLEATSTRWGRARPPARSR